MKWLAWMSTADRFEGVGSESLTSDHRIICADSAASPPQGRSVSLRTRDGMMGGKSGSCFIVKSQLLQGEEKKKDFKIKLKISVILRVGLRTVMSARLHHEYASNLYETYKMNRD